MMLFAIYKILGYSVAIFDHCHWSEKVGSRGPGPSLSIVHTFSTGLKLRLSSEQHAILFCPVGRPSCVWVSTVFHCSINFWPVKQPLQLVQCSQVKETQNKPLVIGAKQLFVLSDCKTLLLKIYPCGQLQISAECECASFVVGNLSIHGGGKLASCVLSLNGCRVGPELPNWFPLIWGWQCGSKQEHIQTRCIFFQLF